jgi:hypothetical protein
MIVTHAFIPNRGEQMIRYYGCYSNQLRGLRNKAGIDDEVPALIDSDYQLIWYGPIQVS